MTPSEYFVFGFTAICGVLGVLSMVWVWRSHRAEKAYRRQFFGQLDPARLRMSPYRLGLVYHVTGEADGKILAVQIWDGKDVVMGQEEIAFAPEDLIPFNPDRFSV